MTHPDFKTVKRQLAKYDEIIDVAMSKGRYGDAVRALDSQTRIIGGFEADNEQQTGRQSLADALVSAARRLKAEDKPCKAIEAEIVDPGASETPDGHQ